MFFKLLTIISILLFKTSYSKEFITYKKNTQTKHKYENFKEYKILSTNYAPSLKYKDSMFSGVKVKDIFKTDELSGTTTLYFIDRTSNFVVNVSFQEAQHAYIANKRNGKSIESSRGLSLIWDKSFLQKIPKKERRKYSCWWVGHIIVDKHEFKLRENKKKLQTLFAKIKFPTPKGFNIQDRNNLFKQRTGVFLSQRSDTFIIATDINNNKIKIDLNNSKVFISEDKLNSNPLAGLRSIYEIEEIKDGQIMEFKNRHFFIKKYEITKK